MSDRARQRIDAIEAALWSAGVLGATAAALLAGPDWLWLIFVGVYGSTMIATPIATRLVRNRKR